MKRILLSIAALALAATAVSCSGKKTGKADTNNANSNTTTAASAQSGTETETATTSTTTAVTTTTNTSKPTSAETPYEINSDGAVVFSEDISKSDDKLLIEAAQALFESACRTEWNFTVGCPFKTDDKFIETGASNWRYYHVSDSDIKSFADVEKAYHKVFSDRYTNKQLSMLYVEEDGEVYALCGVRGSDIYYTSSEITGIKERTKDEITFSVENHYSGSDYGDGAVTEVNDFSVVIGSDNVWKAGVFTLPY